MLFLVKVGSRNSRLARAQVHEVSSLLHAVAPEIILEPVWIETTGDQDRKTSLRTLGKTDFFTKQIDEALLQGRCRIAIHSAKDLPEQLAPGLTCIALTKGVDPSDSIVMLKELPFGGKVGTSSLRREEGIKRWRPDLQVADIRGNVDERLKALEEGLFDAVVVAEAALIRLGLTHLRRETLPGETEPLQGKLAILARKEDDEIRLLFQELNG